MLKEKGLAGGVVYYDGTSAMSRHAAMSELARDDHTELTVTLLLRSQAATSQVSQLNDEQKTRKREYVQPT